MPKFCAHDLVQGLPFGTVLPPASQIPWPAVDGRTVALTILQHYISELTLNRPDANGKIIPYSIPLENIHIEQPDNEADLKFPSIVFRPGEGVLDTIGLTCYLDESTRDVYRAGYVVQEQGEYREIITLECWAASKAIRRSLLAGLSAALVPIEQMYGLRFRMPDYYDRTVCFSLASSTSPDDPDNARNRRWGIMQLEMRFNLSVLYPYVEIEPEIDVEVYDSGYQDPDLVSGVGGIDGMEPNTV